MLTPCRTTDPILWLTAVGLVMILWDRALAPLVNRLRR